jgi:putative OPT family oligopeptide transporter
MAESTDITGTPSTGVTEKLIAATAPDGAPATATDFKPYIPADVTTMPEFTWSAVILGTSLGLIFAASSLYLVLKVGMTVSASIPVAVLAITLFRGFSRAFGLRQATILENNVVQTSGSAGESIAFGVGVTMPALLMLGFQMDLTRVMVVSILGGILGILAMIPLRRAFIVKMHGRPGQPGTLLYPEGTACAQVLISGEKGGTTGTTVFVGFGIAFIHKFATIGLNLIRETVSIPITAINRAAAFAGDMASELLGVGYIIGLRTSAVMMAGAVLGYLVIIPIIYFAGEFAPTVVPPSNEKLIRDMSISDLRNNYLLYIGAGCVAAAGIISMGRTLPMIVRSIRSGLATVRGGAQDDDPVVVRRTDNDMSMRVVLFGSLGLLVLLALFLMAEVGLLAGVAGALLVLLFGFLFVTVSARLTGEIGSSSNPISGMTVATLMLTCLIFLALGWTTPRDRLLALSVAAVVCIASSNGGTTAQSLKTGFLVGGTPKAMQLAILVGAVVSALVIGGTLLAFNAAGTVYSDDAQYLPRDKATNQVVTLTHQERGRLDEKERYQGREYLVWDTRRDNFTRDDYKARPALLPATAGGTAPEGRFLVDPDTGKVSWYVDPTIGGKIKEHDGRETTRFDAPKTRVMTIIIDGVLTQKLNWSLVLIGALMAVTLELCGVSSLAFAVGVYVPIQYSTPIFIGGILRWGIDAYQARSSAASIEAAGDDPEARARAEVEAIRKSETSPGVLLASGYIAGGSLAGVVVAFLEFAPQFQSGINLGPSVAGLGDLANNLIAVALFVALIVFAALVGMGKLFRPPEESPPLSP